MTAPTAQPGPRSDVDVLALAQELIRTPSPNPGGDESAVARLVTDVLVEQGLPRPQVIAKDPSRPNLLSTMHFGEGGSHLVLSGHLDTKPVGDGVWSVDPFGAELDGDHLFGLGSGDMKAAIAAMIAAAARLARSDLSAGTLSLLFTADEEDGAKYGAHHVASSDVLSADGVVIGEPGGVEDDFDRLHLVSRGIARMHLTASADQGHSSLTDELARRNAGADLARAIVAVTDSLHVDVPDNVHALSGWHATVNAGLRFRGGVGYGVLPGRMSADTEVRLLPGMSQDALRASVEEVLTQTSKDHGADLTLDFDDPPNDWLPPTVVAPGHPLAAAAREACRQVFGHETPDSVFPGTTDATWFDALAGIATLPALGPGLLRRAHAADEWVSVTAVEQSVDLYAALAASFCRTPPPEGRRR
ncbi:MAG TPA: M20 family metallopeptidase [Nocardioidaceae bacterium]|nr:M20 family metallopeptidase [Nocardioidaceae bacterium]